MSIKIQRIDGSFLRRKNCAWWEEVNEFCVVQALSVGILSLALGKEKVEEIKKKISKKKGEK